MKPQLLRLGAFAFAVAAALVRMVLPVLSAHVKEWKIITAAMLVTGGLLAIYPLLQGGLWLGFGSAMLGLRIVGTRCGKVQ